MIDDQGTAVGQRGLEVIPDLFVGIELGSVCRKTLDMEPRVTSEKLTDRRTVVNRSSVPEQDDVAAQMTEQQPQETRDLNVGDVVEVEVAVETEALAHRADGDRRDGGDLVPWS